MPRHTPLVLSTTNPAAPGSAPVPLLPSISLLPFSIPHDGSAPISTYFVPTPSTDPSSSSGRAQDRLEATFRGRLILSTGIDLPAGYTGLVFSTSAPVIVVDPNEGEGSRKRAKVEVKKKDEEGKGKGKALMSRPAGGRRSPRKAVQVKYSMDSDDDEDEKTEEVKEEDVQMEVNDDETLPLPPPTMLPLPLPLDRTSSTASVFSTPTTPPSQVLEPLPETQDMDETSLEEIQYLVPQATFERIRVWNPDMVLDVEEDIYARSIIEWVGVASKIHAY